MMQQRSTEQRSTVDSRLTNFKMLHLSVSVSSLETVELLLNVKSNPQSVLRNMSTVCRECCQNQLHFAFSTFTR